MNNFFRSHACAFYSCSLDRLANAPGLSIIKVSGCAVVMP